MTINPWLSRPPEDSLEVTHGKLYFANYWRSLKKIGNFFNSLWRAMTVDNQIAADAKQRTNPQQTGRFKPTWYSSVSYNVVGLQFVYDGKQLSCSVSDYNLCTMASNCHAVCQNPVQSATVGDSLNPPPLNLISNGSRYSLNTMPLGSMGNFKGEIISSTPMGCPGDCGGETSEQNRSHYLDDCSKHLSRWKCPCWVII